MQGQEQLLSSICGPSWLDKPETEERSTDLISITDRTKNKYIWLQWFMTTYPRLTRSKIKWPVAIPDDDFPRIASEISCAFAKHFAGQVCRDRDLVRILLRSCSRAADKILEYSGLATDRGFCRSVVEGIQVYERHPYQYFSPEVRADPELMDLVYAYCPEIILLATKEPTKEFIKKYLPTEDVFKSLIRGKGAVVERYLPFYNSVDVLLAALEQRIS